MTPATDLLPDTAPPPLLPPNPLDEPTFDESLAEWGRYYEYPQGLIPPGHSDDFIAFYDGQPCGYDPDPTALRERVATALGVHPARLVIAYLGTYELVLSISSPIFG